MRRRILAPVLLALLGVGLLLACYQGSPPGPGPDYPPEPPFGPSAVRDAGLG